MQHFLLKSSLATLVLAGTLSAQVGDGNLLLHRFDGLEENMELGSSIASAGDVDGDGVPDILVGAPYARPGGLFQAGSAFVYSGATGAELYRFDGAARFDFLGSSICGLGDLDGDGVDDFAIGAEGSDLGGDNSGVVFVYSGAAGTLIRQIVGFDSRDRFGHSLAGTGDVNGDGYPELLVGANEADPIGVFKGGAAYLISGFNGVVLLQVNGTTSHAYIGDSVATAGDVDGDGTTDLLIGGTNSGSGGQALVYSGATGLLLHQIDGAPGDQVGLSVAGAGDVNQDGYDDFLVGAPRAVVSGYGTAGFAALYSGFDSSIIYKFEAVTSGGDMGQSVAGASDVDGDGVPDLLVGSHSANHGGVRGAGAVYIYSGATGLELHRLDGEVFNNYFGFAIAPAGDLNGDGLGDVLVGAPYASPNSVSEAGSAYAFSLRSYLRFSQTSISVSTASMIDLTIDFPTQTAGFEYRVLMSLSGNGPFRFGVDIPLTFDNILLRSYFGNYPFSSYSYLQGLLDPQGDALAHIGVPPGLYSQYVGSTVWIAVVANPVGQLPEYSSFGIPIMLVP